MADSEKKPACGEDDAKKAAAETSGFPIRDLPDLRKLRKSYVTSGDKPIAVDSNDNPRPDEHEEDFGLTRSTAEEAWKFFRDSVEDGEDKDRVDDLTEFLDDI